MKPSSFFVEEQDPSWEMNGAPWSPARFQCALDVNFLEQLRKAPQEGSDEIEVAYALGQLAHDELLAYGTGGGERLDDAELSAVLRTLRAVSKRIGATFDVPFRDFKGFHGYWSTNGMGGSYAARRGYLSELFGPLYAQLDDLADSLAANSSIRGVDGVPKNLIFGSSGAKPVIVLRDAINNTIEITKNAEYCLLYDRPLGDAGLTWGELTSWWRQLNGLDGTDRDVARSLYKRLSLSMRGNEAEQAIFRNYCERYSSSEAAGIPALLPQVYLHYDPLNWRQRGDIPGVLPRERMDFLLLLPGRVRVVVELDGKQHYSDGETASPRLYANMVAEDRKLRLLGYEVYRFGGLELIQPGAEQMLRNFFDALLAKYADLRLPGQRP